MTRAKPICLAASFVIASLCLLAPIVAVKAPIPSGGEAAQGVHVLHLLLGCAGVMVSATAWGGFACVAIKRREARLRLLWVGLLVVLGCVAWSASWFCGNDPMPPGYVPR